MTRFLVGGYGADMDGEATGMSWARSDAEGAFRFEGLAIACPSPSWLTVSGDRVYAALEGANELATYALAGDGLRELSRVPAGGEVPCHVAAVGDAAVVACYGDGAVAVHRPDAGPVVLPGSGTGPRDEQEGPHAHHVHVVGDRVLTLDLGADAVHEHDLSMTRLRTVRLPAGTGPRDLLPLPDGRIAVLGELSGDVLTLSPALEVLHSARIPGFSDGDHAAALALVRERFVVTGVRGSDVLATLEVTDAGLEPVASVATAGRWPRHLVADGSVIHVANQLSSTVTSFSVDARGIPTLLGEPVAVPSPTCLAAVGGAANLW